MPDRSGSALHGPSWPVGRLEATDVEMLRAEQRGADFGIFVELHLTPGMFTRCRAALARTIASWPTLSARIVADGEGFVVVHDPAGDVTELETGDTLRGRTILAARGNRLFRYHLDPARGVVELLAHHVVLDAHSLQEFVADLDHVLLDDEAELLGEWPWRPLDVAVVLPSEGPLAAAGYPQHGEHLKRPLEQQVVERVEALAQRSGTTPFAVFWAAGARLGSATSEPSAVGPSLGGVVSDRAVLRLGRAGNATRHLSVALDSASVGAEEVKARYLQFVRAWSAPADATRGSRTDLLLSVAGVPDATGLSAITSIVLGPYVVKFARHVQLQMAAGRVWIECYDPQGGEQLMGSYLRQLNDLLDQRPVASPTDEASVKTASTTSGPLGESGEDAPLERVLSASPSTDLRDLHVSSFDVLAVLHALASDYGVRVGVEDFYRWETAGEVQELVRSALSDGRETAPAAKPAGVAPQWSSVVLPHLNDIFIDAYRHGRCDPYAVEFAFPIDGGVDLPGTTQIVQQVVARHEMLSARVGFSAGGVTVEPADPIRVRSVRVGCWDEARDPRPLRLRLAEQRLADLAVVEFQQRFWFYLKVHHLLIDDAGIQSLLADIGRAAQGIDLPEPSSWPALAAELNRSAEAAQTVWQKSPVDPTAYPAIGRPMPAGGTGDFHQSLLELRRTPSNDDLTTVLAKVAAALAELTHESRGTFGSVHHGRTVPSSATAVGSFARVLPLEYDVRDPRVIARSVSRVLRGQATTAAGAGWTAGTGFPIAFQRLRAHGIASSQERVEFGGRTKFAVLLTLLDDAVTPMMEVTVAADAYSEDALDELTAALARHLDGHLVSPRAA